MEFQRFSAPDAGALEAGIIETEAKLRAAVLAQSAVATVEHAADLGSMLTTARRERESIDLLVPLLGLAESIENAEPAGWFWNSYATALQYSDRREEANSIFGKALSLCRLRGWSRLESFVLQHWGRSLVEQGNLLKAQDFFTQALTIRERLEDPRQASTKRALAELAAIIEAKERHGRQPSSAA